MAYQLTIACGVVLAALLIGLQSLLARGRGVDALSARVVRRALLFVTPLFLVALLFSLHHYWLGATADIVKTSATIGQLEDAIARVQIPLPLHAALHGQNAIALGIALLVLAALPFVRPGAPYLGIGKGVAAGVGAVYVVALLIVSGTLLGHDAVRDVDARVERLKGHVLSLIHI